MQGKAFVMKSSLQLSSIIETSEIFIYW